MHNHPIKAGPLTPRLPAFYFGGDYNPEQWTPAFGYEDETIWREDIRLMRLANVNVATVGIFSWVSLQPDEHTFTFGWLDRVMDLQADQPSPRIASAKGVPSTWQLDQKQHWYQAWLEHCWVT